MNSSEKFSNEQLLRFVDGELGQEEVRQIERYIATDPEAAAYVKKHKMALDLLSEAYGPREEPSEEVKQLIAEKMRNLETRSEALPATSETDNSDLDDPEIPPDIPIDPAIIPVDPQGANRRINYHMRSEYKSLLSSVKQTSAPRPARELVSPSFSDLGASEPPQQPLPAVPPQSLPAVPPPPPANDNSWMRMAASLLIVAFVGYGIYSPYSGPGTLSPSEQQVAALIQQLETPPSPNIKSGTAEDKITTAENEIIEMPHSKDRGEILRGGGIAEVKHVAADRDFPFNVRIGVKSGIDPDFRSISVSDGDVLAPGDELFLTIDPLKDGRLSVDFRGHDGKVQELFPGSDVLRGENIRLPNLDKSPRYTIDPGEGVETFIIRFESNDTPGEPIIREISYLKTSEADVDVQETYSIEDGIETGDANLRKRYADFFSMAGDKEFLGVFSVLSTATPHKTRGAGDQRVFDTVAPSVVKVLTFDGHGSGLVVRGDGLIATNLHVIRGYSRVGINFFPGNRSGIDPDKTYFAEIVKVNEHADLALLKLQGDIPNLVPAKLAAGKTLKRGQDVHAIGHPHGIDWHYSKGPVGKVEKDFEWPSGPDKKVFHKADVILTPASINQGNSGGPLINDASEVVGITTFKKEGADGLNFAVSVDELSRLIKAEGSIRFVAMPKTDKFLDKPGVIALDVNKNGTSDLYLLYSKEKNLIFGIVDKNEDGDVDYYFLDRHADKKIDARIYPRVIGSKRIYYWRIDTDLDGKADAVGLDRDGDWKPDEIKPIRKPRKKSKSLLRYVG